MQGQKSNELLAFSSSGRSVQNWCRNYQKRCLIALIAASFYVLGVDARVYHDFDCLVDWQLSDVYSMSLLHDGSGVVWVRALLPSIPELLF